MTINSGWMGPNVVDGGRTGADSYATHTATGIKLFSGEVFNAFNDATIFKSLVNHYTLNGGKEKQFLLTGKLTAEYHTPGTALAGMDGMKSNEVLIRADDLLVSHQFVYDLDERLAQWQSRGELAKQIGEALALSYDERIARALVEASGASSVVTGEPGGFAVNIGAGNTNNAQAIVDGFFEAAAVLDERSAPQDGRVCVLSPRQYYSLISSVDTNILNRDIGNSQGDMNSGKGLYQIAGISIRKSNVLAGLYGATRTAAAGENNTYADTADLASLAGLIFHKEAVGAVEVIGPSIETTSGDFHVQYQGDLVVGKLAAGAAPLRTSVAGALRTA